MARLLVYAQADGFAVGHEALNIQPGGSADVRIRLQPPCAVAGTIVDDAASPRAGVTVRAGRLRNGPPWYANAAETDAEGRYRIERIAPGDVEMTAEHAQWGSASGRAKVAAEQEGRWDARLDKGLRIRGRVMTEGGKPLPDVDASVSTTGPAQVPTPRSTTTDRDGRFELIHCGDASYRLHLVEKVSWIRSSLVFVPDVRPGPDEHIFVVPQGKMPSSFLTGELRDDRGPVQAAEIGLAWGAEDGGGKSIGAHAVNSPFRIGPLPAGRYIARFSREGGPFLETAPFDLQPRTTVDLGVLWFERFASLTVSVRDAAGAPVAAQAQLEHLVTGDVERAAADESAGPVVLKQLRPGPYALRVLAAGHPPVTQPVSLGSGQELHLEQPVATGVEVTFRLPGIYGAGVTLRWQTDGGETMFVEDVRDRQRRELILQRRFLPGRYVLVVEGHRAAPLLRRVTKDSPAEKPIAECRFDVPEGSKGEVVTLPR